MTLSLPKSSLYIRQVSFASLDIYLVERSVYRNSLNITFSLPKGLHCHVKVLTNSIWTSIPKANPFDKIETEGIIRKREAGIKEGAKIRMMQATMNLVIGSREDRHIKMIACKYLIRFINQFVSFGIILLPKEVLLDFTHINLRHPGVRIDYRYENFIRIDIVSVEKMCLQMLSAPRYITSLSLLLKLTNMMMSVPHQFEFTPELSDKFLGFEFRVLLVSLHRQKYHIPRCSTAMRCKTIQSLRQHLRILLVTGNNESVQQLFLERVAQPLCFFLQFFSSIEDSPAFKESNDGNKTHNSGFEAEIGQGQDAYFLILNLDESRTNKHQRPVDDIEKWNDKFILEVVLKVSYIHKVG